MKTTQRENNHKINNCVRNAYRAIISDYAVNSIWQAYDRPSIYKVRAWEWCQTACKENNGYNLCITGWNCSKFTVAYFCSHHETGKECIIVHTADNVYWAFVDEL